MNKMRIRFVCMGAENLGIEFLSAALKNKGVDVSLSYDPALFEDQISFNIPFFAKLLSVSDMLLEDIIKSGNNIVAFSVMSTNYRWALKLANKIKEINKDIIIIFGGIHPTLVPEVVIRESAVDYVLIGEAEDTLFELLVALHGKKDVSAINGIYYKQDGKIFSGKPPMLNKNLDNIPFPDKDLFVDFHKIVRGTYRTITGRGCPFKCSYCCHDYLKTLFQETYLRRRSVKNVICELRHAIRRYNPTSIHFNDDIFTYDKKWVIHFLEEYKNEIKLPYLCITHPRFVDDDIARLLKESGCYRVKVGIQSLSENIKKKVLNRIEANEEIEKCFSLFDKYKINYSSDHIFGLPGETEKDLQDALNFYSRFENLKMINTYWLTYFPKTSIIEIADRYGVLPTDKVKLIREIEDGYIPTYLYSGHLDKSPLKTFYKRMELLFAARGPLKNERLFEVFSNYAGILSFLPVDLKILLYLISVFQMNDYGWNDYMRGYIKNIVGVILKKVKHLL
ncbi:MAG: B12-binding domain-containing radical SAM protein [bacterium]|nr:B12-binding domain-containing radical SAM protein [bacterium]